MPKVAVVNTSCLIALTKIGLLGLLCKLYDEVIVPSGVLKEFGNIELDCVKVADVDDRLEGLLSAHLDLGRGESEVISLAFKTTNPAIIDDQKARRIAKRLGIIVTGTIGLLLKAEESKLIDSAYEKITELRNKGFHVSDDIVSKVKNKEWGMKA